MRVADAIMSDIVYLFGQGKLFLSGKVGEL